MEVRSTSAVDASQRESTDIVRRVALRLNQLGRARRDRDEPPEDSSAVESAPETPRDAPWVPSGDGERFRIFEEYVQEFGVRPGDSGKRDTFAWRPMRFCQKDWVLAAWVYRFSRVRYEVGLFLAEDHVDYVRDSGVTAGLIGNLSEAYNQTGRFEMHFVGEPDGDEPQVPKSIRELALRHGVELASETSISHEEGCAVYAALSGLTPGTLKVLEGKGVEREQACFVALRRVWRPQALEYIAKYSGAASMFQGGRPSVPRLLFQRERLLLREALLLERLIDTLSGGEPIPVSVELVDRGVVRCTAGGARCLHAALLPMSKEAYGAFLESSAALQSLRGADGERLLVVGQDFLWTGNPKLEEGLQDQSIEVHPVVDSLEEIDDEVSRKLAQTVSTKRAVPERPE